MNFSWLNFCKQYSVPYVEQGPSVSRGNIAVKCPFCGNADPSHHMGLRLDTREPFWGCWRDSTHRGRDPSRLISALLNIPAYEARAIVQTYDQSDIDSYEELATLLQTKPTPQQKVIEKKIDLVVPREFRPLRYGDRMAAPYLAYLERIRGFDAVDNLAWYYDLHYCVSGRFSRRVIIPFFFQNKLVGWTGRAIGPARLRYETLSHKKETAEIQGMKTPAPMNPKSIVFNYDNATHGGETLFVCEGPMDAIKLDWFGGNTVCAVACLGMPEPQQLMVIAKLSAGFKKVCVALDNDSLLKADSLQEELQALCHCLVVRSVMPHGVKDPGELTLDGIKKLIHNLKSPKTGMSNTFH